MIHWLNGAPSEGSNVNDPGTFKYWNNGSPSVQIYTSTAVPIKVALLSWTSIKKIGGIVLSAIKKIGGVTP